MDLPEPEKLEERLAPGSFRRLFLVVLALCFLFNLPNYWVAVSLKWTRIFRDDYRHFLTCALILRSGQPALYHQPEFDQFSYQVGLGPIVGPGVSAPALFAVFIPYTYFDVLTGTRIHLVLNHLLLGLSLWLVWRIYRLQNPRGDPPYASMVALSVGAYVWGPFLDNLLQGQLNLIVLACTVGSLYLWLQKRPYWAGAVLSLAVSAKVFPVLVAAYFLFSRDWRAPVSTAFCFVLSNFLVAEIFGFHYFFDWFIRLFSFIRTHERSFEDQSINGTLVDLAGRFAPGDPRALSLAHGVSALFCLLVVLSLVWLFLRQSRLGRTDRLKEFSLVIAAQYLLSTYSGAAHHMGLIAAFCWTLLELWEGRIRWAPAFLGCYAVIACLDGYDSRILIYAKLEFAAMDYHIPALAVLLFWLLLFFHYLGQSGSSGEAAST